MLHRYKPTHNCADGFPVNSASNGLVEVYSSAAGENFRYSGYFSAFAIRSVTSVSIPLCSSNDLVQNVSLFRKNLEIFGLFRKNRWTPLPPTEIWGTLHYICTKACFKDLSE